MVLQSHNTFLLHEDHPFISHEWMYSNNHMQYNSNPKRENSSKDQDPKIEHNLQMNIESRFSSPLFSTTTTSKIILWTTCHPHQEYDTPFIQKHLIFFTPTPKLSVYQPSFTYLDCWCHILHKIYVYICTMIHTLPHLLYIFLSPHSHSSQLSSLSFLAFLSLCILHRFLSLFSNFV